MFILTPCFAASAEWIVSPEVGVESILQIGESVFAGHQFSSDKSWISKYELVYTGCEGNIVHFLYREYKMTNSLDTIIRDPYTVPLTFDLTKGKTVGYLALRMKIIEYDNMTIKIKIVKHLSFNE